MEIQSREVIPLQAGFIFFMVLPVSSPSDTCLFLIYVIFFLPLFFMTVGEYVVHAFYISAPLPYL